jgi:hypothetical protein
MLSRALVTATVLLETFLATFTDTGHTQRVLSVRKFVSYSGTLRREYSEIGIDSQS